MSNVISGRGAGGLIPVLVAAVLVCQASWHRAVGAGNALENYVRQPDSSYNWKRCEQKRVEGGTLTHLELVSQTWREQFWSHHLVVLRPDGLSTADIALLFISGGSYGGPNEKDLEMFRLIAERAGAMVAVLNKVPNQPLYDGRREDALIAYTFDQYTKTGDATWPLLFPMVKSAVRAMDTVQAWAEREWGQRVGRFVVAGASKRGWTTWLSAAVDERVVGVAPMVIDMLNMKVQLEWSRRMYGRPSEEIEDYTRIRFDERIDEPEVVTLRGWVDPFSYRARYTMPKLILLGTNDPYWVVDSLRHYWGDLPGPKLIFQTPNAGHDLAGGQEAVRTLAVFYRLLARKEPLPTLEWSIEAAAGGGSNRIKVAASAAPRRVLLWTADSEDRDFRDGTWTSRSVEVAGGAKEATVDVAAPGSGYRAYLVEWVLPDGQGGSYGLSTEARVIPDVAP